MRNVRHSVRFNLTLIALLLAASLGIVSVHPVPAQAASRCTSLTADVHHFVLAKRGVVLLTPTRRRFPILTQQGWVDQGVLFRAGRKNPGLSAIHIMHRPLTLDRIYTPNATEIKALLRQRYRDHSSEFYASPKPGSCLIPVYRMGKNGRHEFATTAATRSRLAAAGWKQEKIAFYAAGPPARAAARPAPFTIAVMPDTQQEVLNSSDPRFLNRARWLAGKKSELGLRFVTHTGDVVNWDTANHSQYEIASAAMRALESAAVPYSLAIGNHDSQATGVGGSARDPQHTTALQRDTSTFNAYFNPRRYGVATTEFEPGKVDNSYQRYSSGGLSWMLLTLELWPRAGVVAWAKQAVATHPADNVIVVTHDYLSGSGGIEQAAPYGNTTPQQLDDQLIRQYANIRMVFSGHTGQLARRVDTGVHGNRIYCYLAAIHSNSTNPVRLVTVDTAKRTIKTWVYAPYTNTTWSGSTITETGVSFVR